MYGLYCYGSCVWIVNLTRFPLLVILGNPLNEYQVVIAAGFHLFPFRTEKLSPLAPMVLQCNVGE